MNFGTGPALVRWPARTSEMEIARRPSSEGIRFTNRQRNIAATTTNVSRNVPDSMDELSWAEGNCDRCRFSTYRSQHAGGSGKFTLRKRRLPGGRENLRDPRPREGRLRCAVADPGAAGRHGRRRAKGIFASAGRMGP